jgi:amino acid adenylation domain-containing protein/thioester reductase-like protein/non-ribosomal peptide synthase protein (TIGR01720 family)
LASVAIPLKPKKQSLEKIYDCDERISFPPILERFFNLALPDVSHFNQAFVIIPTIKVECTRLQCALRALTLHHEALRMRFDSSNGSWTNTILSGNDVESEVAVYSDQPVELSNEDYVTLVANQLHVRIDVKGSLQRFALVNLRDGTQRIVWIIHHLVVDGISWRILTEDLFSVYANVTISLSRTTSFCDWREELFNYALELPNLEKLKEYWLSQLRGSDLQLTYFRLPDDGQPISRIRNDVFKRKFSADFTRRLLSQSSKAYHTKINDLLLAALSSAYGRVTGQKHFSMLLEGHGREFISDSVDVSRTVGWFTSIFPVVLSCLGEVGDAIMNVKEELRRIPHNGLSYGLLKYLLPQKSAFEGIIEPRLLFNYLGQFQSGGYETEEIFRLSNENSGRCVSEGNERKSFHDLCFNCEVINDELNIYCDYSDHLLDASKIEILVNNFVESLENIVEHCCSISNVVYTPSDFPLAGVTLAQLKLISSQFEKEKISFVDLYKTTPLQSGMYFTDLYTTARSDRYVVSQVLSLDGDLNVDLLKRSWLVALKTIPILRTGFLNPNTLDTLHLLQYVAQEVHFPWEERRLAEITDENTALDDVINEDRKAGFSLDKPPLFRLKLLSSRDNYYYLLFSFHHIILDGWSVANLLSTVFSFYNQLKMDYEPAPLDAIPPFRSYINWLQNQSEDESKKYWNILLRNCSETNLKNVKFKTDNEIGELKSVTPLSSRKEFFLSEKHASLIRNLSKSSAITLCSIFQALWAKTLGHFTQQQDVVFGSVVSGRSIDLEGVERMVGLFIKTFPVRANVANDISLSSLALMMQSQMIQMHDRAYISLANILSFSGKGLSLFDTILAFENYPEREISLTGVTVLPKRAVESPEYPMTLTVSPVGNTFAGQFIYDTSHFTQHCVEQLEDCFVKFVGNIELKSNDNLRIFTRLNEGSWTSYPRESTVTALFVEQVRRTPSNVAIAHLGKTISYLELYTRAHKLAFILYESGVRPHSYVAVSASMDSLELVIAIVAVLLVGCAYVPLHNSNPDGRIQFMLDDIGCEFVMIDTPLKSRFEQFRRKLIVIDLLGQSAALSSDLVPVINATDALYVMYTSGTTGISKGTIVSHRNVVRFVKSKCAIEFSENLVFGSTSPFAFDASTFNIWGALLNGGRLVLLERDTFLCSAYFRQAILANRINICFITSGLLDSLLLEDPSLFATLDYLLFGGDNCSEKTIKLLREKSNRPKYLMNAYGPTECTTFSTFCCYQSSEEFSPNGGRIIGKAIPNTTLYVLDETMNLCVGEIGELYVGGDGVSLGYLNQPRLNELSFVSNPFCSEQDKKESRNLTLYKTGDLVRLLSNDQLEFHSRKDNQVKIHGYRVELEEIENVLTNIGITSIICLREDTSTGTKYLVAYLLRNSHNKLSEDIFIAHAQSSLRSSLSDYMVPNYYVVVDRFPLNLNGKIDRTSLPNPVFKPRPVLAMKSDISIRSLNIIESLLLDLWSQVLRHDSQITDNFFEEGGDSILALRLIYLAKQHGYSFTVKDIFEHSTIERLSVVTKKIDPELVDASIHSSKSSYLDGQYPLAFVEENELNYILKILGEKNIPEIVDLYETTSIRSALFTHSLLIQHKLSNEEKYDYLIHNVIKFEGNLDVERFKRAWQLVILRFECFRIGFFDLDRIFEFVLSDAELICDLLNWEDLSDTMREIELQTILKEDLKKGFDLSSPPLLRLKLIRYSAKEFVAVIFFHHLILDGWSISIVYSAFREYYNQSGASNAIIGINNGSSRRYLDWFLGQKKEDFLTYWRSTLRGVEKCLLSESSYNSMEKSGPDVISEKHSVYQYIIEGPLFFKLKSILSSNHVTPSNFFQSLWALLLCFYTQKQDVVFGVVVSGRDIDLDGIEEMVGLFINTLPMRVSVGTDATLIDIAKLLQRQIIEITKFATYSLSEILSSHEQFSSDGYLYDSIIVFENYPAQGTFRVDDLTVISSRSIERIELPLSVVLEDMENSSAFSIEFRYHTDVFSLEFVKRIAGNFERVFLNFLENPYLKRPTIESSIINSLDGVTINELFERVVDENPNCVAVTHHGNEMLTYNELNRRANRFATHLRKNGVARGTVVAIFLPRSIFSVIAMLGVLKSGGIYLPVDVSCPLERVRYYMENSRSSALITNYSFKKDFGDIVQPVIYLDSFESISETSSLDERNLNIQNRPTDVMFIMYTSGSTGLPKPVAISQRNIAHIAKSSERLFRLNRKSVVTHLQNLSFDNSALELWSALLVGANLFIVDYNALLITISFEKEISRASNISLCVLPAKLFELFLFEDLMIFKTVAFVCVCGDVINSKAVQLFFDTYKRSKFPQLVNGYGPTETTINATYHFYSKNDCYPQLGHVIGRPVDNVSLYILDDQLRQLPDGKVGELHIGGDGVSCGYYLNQSLTNEKFISNPFASSKDVMIYKTGDFVRYLADGALEFIGRRDNQVKIRGFRVELEEIENKILENKSILHASVIVRTEESGDTPSNLQFIVGFLILRDNSTDSARFIKDLSFNLAKTLPDYMVPHRLLVIEKFPFSLSGKLDKKALENLYLDQVKHEGLSSSMGVPLIDSFPLNNLTGMAEYYLIKKKIQAIWSQILNNSDLDEARSFFDQGGNSLLIGRLTTRLCKEFNLIIAVTPLFTYSTIITQAEYVYKLKNSKSGDSANHQQENSINRDSLLKSLSETKLLDSAVPIANRVVVIGMSGKFSGSNNLDEFWNMLIQSKTGISEFSVGELVQSGHDESLVQLPNYVRAKGVLPIDSQLFDHTFFAMSQHEAACVDPQHRLLLEETVLALEDAGIDYTTTDARIGVFFSCDSPSYAQYCGFFEDSSPANSFYTAVGNIGDTASTFTAYKLNLRGPSYGVQSACSSSLAALHVGCLNILSQECPVAVVGGVSVSFPQRTGYIAEDGMIFAPDGRTRSLDQAGQGCVPGEGVGVVVLASEEYATRHGLPVRAIVLGSSVNNDGAKKQSYGASNASQQVEVIKETLRKARLAPGDVQFSELHGSGTKIGDSIELEAHAKVYENIICGSVKSQIGHTGSAAGIAGFIKSVLVIENGVIPPTLGFERFQRPMPNCYASSSVVPWPFVQTKCTDGGFRRASVHSFGMGGTNVHAILQSAPGKKQLPRSESLEFETVHLIAISAASKESLLKWVRAFCKWLEDRKEERINIASLSYSLHMKPAYAYRIAFGSESNLTKLTQILDSLSEKDCLKINLDPVKVYLFSGQLRISENKVEYVESLRHLYKCYFSFRGPVNECLSILKRNFDWLARGLEEVDDVAQTIAFIVAYALAAMLRSWGISSSEYVGFSFGEYLAACLSGCISLRRALQMVELRQTLIERTAKGMMIAVNIDERALGLLLTFYGSIGVAARNDVDQFTITGPLDVMQKVYLNLTKNNYLCTIVNSRYGFHSKEIMNSIVSQLIQEYRILNEIESVVELFEAAPNASFISCTSMKRMSAEELTPEYWGNHLLSTVNLYETNSIFLSRIESKCINVIECSAKPSLGRFFRKYNFVSPFLNTEQSLATLWKFGCNVNWNEFHNYETSDRLDIPKYVFTKSLCSGKTTLAKNTPSDARGERVALTSSRISHASMDGERLKPTEVRHSSLPLGLDAAVQLSLSDAPPNAVVLVGVTTASKSDYYYAQTEDTKREMENFENFYLPLGCLTKIFTVYVMYLLIEKGLLSLNSKISDILRDQEIPSITVFQLLSNTSGLPFNPPPVEVGEMSLEQYTSALIPVDLKRVKLLFEPGKNCTYSVFGNCVLGYIAEQLTGSRFTDLFREFVFDRMAFDSHLIGSPMPLVDIDGRKVDLVAPMDGVISSFGLSLSLKDFGKFSRYLFRETAIAIFLANYCFSFQSTDKKMQFFYAGSSSNSGGFFGFDFASNSSCVVLANSSTINLSIATVLDIGEKSFQNLLGNPQCRFSREILYLWRGKVLRKDYITNAETILSETSDPLSVQRSNEISGFLSVMENFLNDAIGADAASDLSENSSLKDTGIDSFGMLMLADKLSTLFEGVKISVGDLYKISSLGQLYELVMRNNGILASIPPNLEKKAVVDAPLKDAVIMVSEPKRISPESDILSFEKRIVSLKLSFGSVKATREPPLSQVVFITGATGYLGRYILAQLLDSGFTCVCLVRGSSHRIAEERLQKVMVDSAIWNPRFKNQIEILCGDISEERFGLALSAYETMQRNVSFIVNCAQESSWILKYEDYRGANVCGVFELIKLANIRTLPIYHISTVGVFTGKEGIHYENAEVVLNSDQPDFIKSKVVAESLFRHCNRLGIPFFILRPEPYSFTGHSVKWNQTKGMIKFFERFLKTFIEIEAIPLENSNLPDWTPIDFVASTICNIIEVTRSYANFSALETKYHITSPHERISYHKFGNILHSMGFKINRLKMDAIVNLLLTKNTALSPAFITMDQSALFGAAAVKSFENTKSLLKLNDRPPAFIQLLPNYVIQLLKQRYIELNFPDFHSYPSLVSIEKDQFVLPIIVISSEMDLVALRKFLKENRWTIEGLILKHGGVVIKRSPVRTAEQFSKVSKILYGGRHMFHSYVDGISPRTVLTVDGVFTSTEYSKSQDILMHNEMSYSHFPPSKIMFFCSTPPGENGETPVASSKLILDEMKVNPLLKKHIHKDVTYVSRLPKSDGLGRSWSQAYQTHDERVVEAKLKSLGINYYWGANQVLITERKRSFFATHPIAGHETWFNHIIIYHPSNLPRSLKNQHQDQLPKNCYFGEKETISDDVVVEITEIAKRHEACFTWELGDLLLLDNMLCAHGRKPFSGQREIMVTLSI